MLGWWFVCIGTGFILLLIRGLLLGQRPWISGVRAVIAAGFLLLGWQTLRASNANPRSPGKMDS